MIVPGINCARGVPCPRTDTAFGEGALYYSYNGRVIISNEAWGANHIAFLYNEHQQNEMQSLEIEIEMAWTVRHMSRSEFMKHWNN